MNRQPHLSFSRTLGVLVLLAAWLVLSNHCALAVMVRHANAAETAEAHKCCAGNRGGEQPLEQPMATCCKSLRVLLTDAGVKLVKTDALPVFVCVWVALTEGGAVGSQRPHVTHTTGPPKTRSFAELVLQRSLLSHAPPFAA